MMTAKAGYKSSKDLYNVFIKQLQCPCYGTCVLYNGK